MSDCDICEGAEPAFTLCAMCLVQCEQRAATKARAEERASVDTLTAQLAARDATIADLTSALAHEKNCRLSQLAAMSRKLAARDARIAQLEAALGECVRVVKVPIYGSPIDGACRYTYDEEAHAAARALLAPRAEGGGK